MSSYVIRHIEARMEEIDGIIFKPSKLPSDAPDGTIYRISSPDADAYILNADTYLGKTVRKWAAIEPKSTDEIKGEVDFFNDLQSMMDTVSVGDIYKVRFGSHKYYERVSGKWVPKDPTDIRHGWRLLKTYGVAHNSDIFALETEKANRKRVTIDGNEVRLIEHNEWSNNGGPMRDDYLSEHMTILDCPFRSRGIPKDISKETLKAMTYDGKISGYSHTWATLDELYSFYETEEHRIRDWLIDSLYKKAAGKIEKKLDFIIRNMRNPKDMNLDEIFPPEKDDDEESDNDESYLYETLSDEFNKLFFISKEIATADIIGEFSGIYSDSSIRIIFYIE